MMAVVIADSWRCLAARSSRWSVLMVNFRWLPGMVQRQRALLWSILEQVCVCVCVCVCVSVRPSVRLSVHACVWVLVSVFVGVTSHLMMSIHLHSFFSSLFHQTSDHTFTPRCRCRDAMICHSPVNHFVLTEVHLLATRTFLLWILWPITPFQCGGK